MKYIHLIIAAIILVLNLTICLLFDCIGNPSLIISSAVIVTTAAINTISGLVNQKNGFKVAMPFLITFNGLAEYVLSFFVNETIKNNGFFIAIIILFAIQIITLIITTIVSKQDK